MKAHQLMMLLAERDIHVSAKDGELTVRASKGALTEDLKRDLVRLKPDIVALLQDDRSGARGGHEAASTLRTLVPDPANRFEPFPFADLQMAFYMADDPYLQFHVRPHYYCETDKSELDIARFEKAVDKTLRRHQGEMVLLAGDGQLRALRELPPFKCEVNDMRGLARDEVAKTLADMRARMSREQLSLSRWPWFDLIVSRWLDDGSERFRIHWNHNNFYSDGYGATILQRDIDRCYADPDIALPPLTLTFRDAVLGLDALSRSPEGDRAKAYWMNRLADLPGPPDLPMTNLDRRCRSRLQRRQGFMPASSWQAFKSHAAQHGLTPTGAIVCAYAEVLSAWSGSRHFILSNMVTRRLPLHPEIMELVGNFASLYPLEVDLRGDLSFAAKAVRLQQQMMRDAGQREWGGMQVMQALNRLKGEMGVVPCPFVVGSGLFMERYRKADFACLETAQTVFDHQFWELDDGRYFYVWDLLEEFFPQGMVDAMWTAFEGLLGELAHDAGAWARAQFELAPAAERQFSAPDAATPTESPGLLHDGLSAAAREHGQQVAVISAGRQLSYFELDGWAQALAVDLRERGVTPNELVAVVMDRGPCLAAATFGILQAGAAYVPIDPALPTERMHYMLANSQARLVLTDKVRRERTEWPANVQVIDMHELVAGRQALGELMPSTSASEYARPEDLAYVIYTSGSTGRPKGVMIEHGAAHNTVVDINRRFGVDGKDVIFGVSSFSFDLSVYDLFGAAMAGATLVYPDPDAALNPAHWLDLLIRHGVTAWNSAPPLMGLLVEAASRRGVQLPDLRLVMLSGDWIPVELPAAIRKMAPSARIVSLGGATEASIWSIYYEIGEVGQDWVRIPYGRALANQAWHIRDAYNRPTPVWTVGDLCISGTGLARGYWADEDKTRQSFVHDPLASCTLYKTGDRGRYLPDGNIEFLGRADTQVKIQGHRIELGEIEAVLQAQAVLKEAVVLAQPIGAATGSGATVRQADRELVAYITLANDADLASATRHDEVIARLRSGLQQQLPVYMVPTGWAVLAAMPLSSNGKIDRKALSSSHYAKAEARAARPAHVAPRTPTECALADIWQALLKLPNVGVHDDFFECGGQSIDAVRCVARVQESIGKSISLGDMWAHRTLGGLAAFITHLDDRIDRGHLQLLGASGPQRAGRPYFMVHPAGGHCVGYHELATMLARPCHGFAVQPQDVAGKQLGTIEAIASRYLAELVRVQPVGPYSLVGWSSGGCIAFEMAAQIERTGLGGGQVDRVTLIDCPAPRVHTPVDARTKLRWFFEDLNLDLPVEALTDELLAELTPDLRFGQAVALMNQRLQGALDEGQLRHIFHVFDAIVDAVLRYRPRPIEAPLLVLRAKAGAVSEFAAHPHAHDPDWGWRGLTSGGVGWDWIEGSHHTVLRQPGVEAIARWLAPTSASTKTIASTQTEGMTSA